MRSPPTTAEILERWALATPHHVAVVEDGRALTHGQFCAMVTHAARMLRQMGVQPGDCVAVGGPAFTLELVLLLAAEGIGACTISFRDQDDPDLDFVLRQSRWVLSGRAGPAASHAGFRLADEAFLAALGQPLATVGGPWVPLPAETTHRISRTSGSGGRSKFMRVPRPVQDYWVHGSVDVNGYDARTRLHIAGPLIINLAYARASACLRAGGTVMAGSGQWLPRYLPTHLWGMPLLLERLLDAMPADWRSPHPVQVAAVGGVLTPTLRQRLRDRLGAEPAGRYGSNEVGGVCDGLDDTGLGIVRPGVDVRILDAQGADLQHGIWGRIALRSSAMVTGYIDRPQETAEAFQDGWFLTPDLGMLVQPRLLRVAGRMDDLVNLGGAKVAASEFENTLRATGTVADCAVVSVHAPGSDMSVGVAAVLAPGASPEAVLEKLTGLFNLRGQVVAQLVVLKELPRLPTGKVDRVGLLGLFRRAAG